MGTEQATFRREPGTKEFAGSAAYLSGQVIQRNGQACIAAGLNSAASGDQVAFYTEGLFDILKSTSVVMLEGQEIWWDESASKATHCIDGDYIIGICNADTTAAATRVGVWLNQMGVYAIEQGKDGWTEVETLGLGVTSEHGVSKMVFDNTSEAATASILSDNSIRVGDKGIFEMEFAVFDKGDASALDLNIGIANAGHATDADTITESVFIHFDGNDLKINAESDDGTTEVNATDTTLDDAVDDTYLFLQIDTRNLADVQVYINGGLVLAATVFKLDAATGPMKILAHAEKTTGTTTADFRVKNARAYQTYADA